MESRPAAKSTETKECQQEIQPPTPIERLREETKEKRRVLNYLFFIMYIINNVHLN